MTSDLLLLQTFYLNSLEETNLFGVFLAHLLKRGDVILLKGDLGVGKTALAQGVIQELLVEKEAITSPTFTLVHSYVTPLFPLWHADLYRLEDPEEVIELGLEEMIQEGVLLLEWPERLPPQYFPNPLELLITMDGQRRHLEIRGNRDWKERLEWP